MTEIIPVLHQMRNDYEHQFGRRLGAADLISGEVVNLMFRTSNEMYKAPVVTGDIKREAGSAGLTLCFLNQDLQPATDTIASTLRLGVWHPDNAPYPLKPHDGRVALKIERGYFLPYTEASDGDIFAELETVREETAFGAQPVPLGWMLHNKSQQ